MQSSAPQELSADKSPSLSQLIPCVTSQVAVQRETVGKEEFRPMTERDKSPMSDEVREAAICRAEAAMVRHEAEWRRTGDFAAKGDADRARRLMLLLIAGRRDA